MCVCVYLYIILQWSPIFLAPGTGFDMNNFSTDRGGGGTGGIVSHGEQEEWQMKLHSLARHSTPAVRPSS